MLINIYLLLQIAQGSEEGRIKRERELGTETISPTPEGHLTKVPIHDQKRIQLQKHLSADTPIKAKFCVTYVKGSAMH